MLQRASILWCGLLLGGLSAFAQENKPPPLFEEAVEAQQRGDNATAARDYQALLLQHPNALEVRVNLGAALVELGRYREAIEESRIVLSADPTNRGARMNLALAYRGNDRPADAILLLERLHQEDAGDGQVVLLLADCLASVHRYSDAMALLSPLESADSGGNAEAYLLAAQTRLAMNQYDLAEGDAQAARRLNPSLPGLETIEGMILEQKGDYDAAEAALKKALMVNADDFDAHLYLGSILYFRRDTAAARLHLKRALQLRPSSSQARYELALVARAEGQFEAALQELETVVRQSPDWLQPHVELSALYYRVHRSADGAREKSIVDRMMAAQQQAQALTAR